MNHTSDKLVEDYEALFNEFNIIRRKLDSKVQALLILSKELDQCRIERDQYRMLTEQLRDRYCSRRRSVEGKSVIQLMCEMKEQNKILQMEANDVKQRLEDSQGDIKLLREQMARKRIGSYDEGMTARQFTSHDREDLVARLESVKIKNSMLERDLQLVLDEKEELVNERDAYKHKVERLNHELNYVLKGDDKRIIDVDALLMENRYLQERLKQIQEEKSLYLQTLSKYKNMLEKRRNQCSMKLGSNGSGGVIITHKQVQMMLQNTSLSQLPTTQATIADLRSLALALFESLNDKNIALAHQKKANKILGHRVTELENKMKKAEMDPPPLVNQDLMVVEPDGIVQPVKDEHFHDNHNINGDERQGSSDVVLDSLTRSKNGCDSQQNCSSATSILSGDLAELSTFQQMPGTPTIIPEDHDDKCNSPTSKEIIPNETAKDIHETEMETNEELPPTLLKLVKEALENLDNEDK